MSNTIYMNKQILENSLLLQTAEHEVRHWLLVLQNLMIASITKVHLLV